MTLNVILVIVAGLVLFLYIGRRRARLRGEDSEKK
jgi:hypothetical protein